MTTGVEGAVEGTSVPPPPAADEERVGQSVFWLTVANLAQKASSVVLAVLLRVLLGPAKTGVWNLIEVWRQQLSSLTLGAHWAADREMPMLRAQGRHDEVDEVRNVTFTYLAGEAAALAIGFWVYLMVDHSGWSSTELLGLALVPVLATFTTLYSGYETFLKNQKAFRLWARFSLTQLVIDWSVIVWVLAGDLNGLIIGLTVGWALRLASVWWLVRHHNLFRLRPTLNGRRLKALLAFGAPLAVWNVGYTLILRLDAIAIGSALGTTALGLYYLGPQIAVTLGAIPTALSVVSYPALMERYGREGPAALAPHIKDYMRSLSLIAAPATAAVGLFGLPVVVHGFLPDFEAGLPAMKVALLTLLVSQPSLLFLQLLLANKQVGRLMTLTAVALAVEVGVLATGSLDGLTIEWAAWAAVAGQATFALLALGAMIRQLQLPRDEVTGFWGRLPIAWGAFVGIALGVDSLVPDADGLLASVGTAAGQFALFVAASAAVVALIDRDALKASRALLRRGT